MDRYRGPHTALTIALHGGHYLPIVMHRYGMPHTAIVIALYGGL
jgi:hypothetical protein